MRKGNLLKEIDEENKAENEKYGEQDLEEYHEHKKISLEEIKSVVENLKERIEKIEE